MKKEINDGTIISVVSIVYICINLRFTHTSALNFLDNMFGSELIIISNTVPFNMVSMIVLLLLFVLNYFITKRIKLKIFSAIILLVLFEYYFLKLFVHYLPAEIGLKVLVFKSMGGVLIEILVLIVLSKYISKKILKRSTQMK